jgi:hypothetical protein
LYILGGPPCQHMSIDSQLQRIFSCCNSFVNVIHTGENLVNWREYLDVSSLERSIDSPSWKFHLWIMALMTVKPPMKRYSKRRSNCSTNVTGYSNDEARLRMPVYQCGHIQRNLDVRPLIVHHHQVLGAASCDMLYRWFPRSGGFPATAICNKQPIAQNYHHAV